MAEVKKVLKEPRRFTVQEAEDNRQKILQLAKAACEKAGGAASINDRYAFVDTTKYNVTPKE